MSNVVDFRPRQKNSSLIPEVVASIDIANELSTNLSSYIGKKSVPVRSFPAPLKICLEQFRRRISDSSPPSMNALISCCAYCGVRVVKSDPSVSALAQFRNDIYADSSLEALELEEIHGWLTRFQFYSRSGHRHTFQMPEYIQFHLKETSDTLGMTVTSLLILSCMISVSQCDGLASMHGKWVRDEVESFFKKARIRKVMVSAVLAEVQRWGSSSHML